MTRTSESRWAGTPNWRCLSAQSPVVVVIGLVIGYAVLSAASQRQNQPNPPTSQSGSGTSSNASQPPAQTVSAVLTDASMLNPGQAEILDRDRTWKVELTQRNPSEDALDRGLLRWRATRRASQRRNKRSCAC